MLRARGVRRRFSRRGLSRLRHDRQRPPGRRRADRAGRARSPGQSAMTSSAIPCWSPPARPAKTLTRCAISPIAPPARWATRWPKPPSRRGARVILISGPTGLDAPESAERISVRSTEEMHRAVLAHLSPATIVVMAAAVADYRPVAPRDDKIKRQSDRLTLELEATPDILADVVRHSWRPHPDRLCGRNRQRGRKRAPASWRPSPPT